jgi:hypothetical protein
VPLVRRLAITTTVLLAFLAFAATPAFAGQRSHAPDGGITAAARVRDYWTPERMDSARPLDLAVDGSGTAHLRPGRPAAAAGASFLRIETPEVPPYSVNGRIFVKQGKLRGYCSGTAINTPTRQLVLTAGHCVNNGHEGGRRTIWSQYLEFVPAYTAGTAPFGAFVAERGKVYAPAQWTKHGNPDFDIGAFLAAPNEAGAHVADAVGGGATIALGLSRHQRFQTFGYPGNVQRMQGCNSPYIGNDVLTNPFSGPPTLGIRCHWAPGASGGGWLIANGTMINGLTSYLHAQNKTHTYGPYFTQENVGRLVAGL